ncbi:DUF349 domain-containing protein [Gangjinia marincola]|uniref:DUF349 domain-containing protein n=1 Tax=Gangjinia marincola TaxID=578463 RepID=A0ABN1MIQ6_9FLAO
MSDNEKNTPKSVEKATEHKDSSTEQHEDQLERAIVEESDSASVEPASPIVDVDDEPSAPAKEPEVSTPAAKLPKKTKKTTPPADEHEDAVTSIVDEKEAVEKKSTTPTTTVDEEEEPLAQAVVAESKKQDSAQDEIDDANAEDGEDETANQRHDIQKKDYHAMDQEELVKELNSLVKNHSIQSIKEHVDEIKAEFTAKYNEELEQKKEDFLEDGGNIIDFYYVSTTKKNFDAAYREYRNKRNEYYNNLKNRLQDNLKNREEIIEELKGLIGAGSDMRENFNQFKALQERWRNAGPIPRDKYNLVWNTYHHHVEHFYDFLHLDREFRDLDFKHNLEEKLKIIERAEALAEQADVNKAFRELQHLHKIWKEELGPVEKEKRDEIWEQFSAATKKIHEKRQANFAEMEKDFEKNLEVKKEIIRQIEEIANKEITSHKMVQQHITQVEQLREMFFKAGKVPRNVNEQTWAEFKETVRRFNRNKNAFYKKLKKEQFANLEKKRDLIKIANDNKDSDDFKVVTPLMKKIQQDWKNIGHVPRRDSDKIWKEFKAACNYYFDRLHKQRNEENKGEMESYDAKKALLDKLKALEIKDVEKGLAQVKELITAWRKEGRVPRHKSYIEGKFNKALDHVFEQLKLSKTEAEMLKYENRLDRMDTSQGSYDMSKEVSFIKKKISEATGELRQLENNMAFFSNAGENNPLFKEANKNLERHRQQLKTWKAKLRKLNQVKHAASKEEE